MLQVGQLVKGYISCGTANPFYNKLVLLKVVSAVDDELVQVQTVDAETFKHHIDTFNNKHELLNSRVEYQKHTYTNWLKVEKGYEIVK